jgi:hypothetical protein
MFQADVRETGIVYRDDEGRVADFHSLRHTFISNLARSGVHPKTAQALARHSTITLTMDRYSHSLIGEQADALKDLPDLTGPAANTARMTGTDNLSAPDGLASCLAFSQRKQYAKVDSIGLSTESGEQGGESKKPLQIAGVSSGEGGIRTLERVSPLTVFETVPINHSGTSP